MFDFLIGFASGGVCAAAALVYIMMRNEFKLLDAARQGRPIVLADDERYLLVQQQTRSTHG